MEYMKGLVPTAFRAGTIKVGSTCHSYNLTENINCTPAILDNPLLTPRCSSRTTRENSTWSETNLTSPEMSAFKNAQPFQNILDAALYSGAPSDWSWMNPEPLTPPAIQTSAFDGKYPVYHQTCQPKAHSGLEMFGFTLT